MMNKQTIPASKSSQGKLSPQNVEYLEVTRGVDNYLSIQISSPHMMVIYLWKKNKKKSIKCL